MCSRDPFPIPKLENDFSLSGLRPPQVGFLLIITDPKGKPTVGVVYVAPSNCRSYFFFLEIMYFIMQGKICGKPTHIAQTEEPWSRLHDTTTLASTRRSVMHYKHQVVSENLNFHCYLPTFKTS